MGEIKLLSQDLINKIAAGEVVERPASVVKELIDNSIDAGAKNIDVYIRNGGENLIKVVDDGKGIKEEDLELAIESHATSKLKSIQDLNNIMTLGFRGEALASIASVSKFTLRSKHQDSDFAWELTNINAKWEKKKTALNSGTSVEVANLFYNVPARKKFLKSTQTEFSHIVNLFINFALIFPNISFRLFHNDKEYAYYPKSDSWSERIKQVLSEELFNNLLFIEKEFTNFKIKLYLSSPNKWQSNRKSQYIFVNKRAIVNHVLNKAIMDGIGHLIPPKHYPAFVLDIEIDPNLVDVNIHPRKLEIKFINEQEIFRALRNLVWGLMNSNLGMEIDSVDNSSNINLELKTNQNDNLVKNTWRAPRLNIKSSSPKNILTNTTNFQSKQDNFSFEASKKLYEPLEFNNDHNKKLLIKDWKKEEKDILENKKWKIVGQVDKKFIIVELSESLWIIDQHALAEGILHKKLKDSFDIKANLEKQALLMPERVELSSWQKALFEEYQDVLEEMSFEVEEFGNNSYIIQAIPADLVKMPVKEMFIDLLNELALNDKNLTIEEKRDRILKYTACRSAIKFGDELSIIEMDNLIKEMFELSVYTCAHGRPVYWEINYHDLLKKFER